LQSFYDHRSANDVYWDLPHFWCRAALRLPCSRPDHAGAISRLRRSSHPARPYI
jgi:hypothetical protein